MKFLNHSTTNNTPAKNATPPFLTLPTTAKEKKKANFSAEAAELNNTSEKSTKKIEGGRKLTPMPVETRKQRINNLLRWARKQLKEKNSPFRDITPLYQQALLQNPLVGEQTAKSYARAALRILQDEQRKKRELSESK